MPFEPGILARGPWAADQIRVRWRSDQYEPHPDHTVAADAAIAALEDRGSPSHDGLGARLAAFEAAGDGLALELQEIRWGLRLVAEDASASLSVLCVARDTEGRWLAGRRASWVATWAGRWALGAGGSVEVGEDPVETLGRELQEEWAVTAERMQVEALVCLPNRMTMLVAQAWLPEGAQITMDSEHDDYAWWPADPDEWPDEADPALVRIAKLLSR